ncbi:membrane protein [Cryobacterium roopkundense]|uniref:Membrane protein n=1 Tax=Cryobacterium roopkundense TaxID=1001240 RepID=A0A099J3X2_9MICO|nr:PLDc N-terminal domain-containing protein [Cryobacterium roopkundense]KGJ72108.1 membrane protein [Cryobacterium roopkundense]MBB5641953.1 hypothetical protein [Cryobacterium roopkundense]
MKKVQSFRDLDPAHKTATIMGTAVQLTLAAAAWNDLARRPAASVRGRKAIWAGVIAVNFVGPITYFVWGRLPR